MREYFDVLVRHEFQLWSLVDRQLRLGSESVSLGRLEILRAIDELGPCRVQDLCDRIGISVGAVSRLTDRLAADGLCERLPDVNDRRSSRIVLTARGRSALASTESDVSFALSELLTGIDPDVVAAATASLTQIRKHLLRIEKVETDE